MKHSLKFGVIYLFLAFGCAHQHQGQNHSQKHHHHDAHKMSAENSNERLKPNDGRKWKPDKVMRENMDSIHSNLVKLISKDHSKEISQMDYQDFYTLVSSRTETIITNCKMSPEMDEAFHVILERMLEANEKLKTKETQKEATGEFINAFMDYQKYFDHKLSH